LSQVLFAQEERNLSAEMPHRIISRVASRLLKNRTTSSRRLHHAC